MSTSAADSSLKQDIKPVHLLLRIKAITFIDQFLALWVENVFKVHIDILKLIVEFFADSSYIAIQLFSIHIHLLINVLLKVSNSEIHLVRLHSTNSDVSVPHNTVELQESCLILHVMLVWHALV